MFKKTSLIFFILFSLILIYECKSGSRSRSKIPKIIKLSDENSTLELDTQYFIDLNPDTFNDIPSLNEFPMEACPRVQEKSFVGCLSFISTDKEYDLHKAIENDQYHLSKFILQFHRPCLNVKFQNQTLFERAINNVNPKITKLLLSQSGITVDESHLKLAKENLSKLCMDKREYDEGVVLYRYRASSSSNVSEIPDVSFYQNNIQRTKKICRMLINRLGLYSEQSRISKNGIVGAYGLPIELACYIATFIHE